CKVRFARGERTAAPPLIGPAGLALSASHRALPSRRPKGPSPPLSPVSGPRSSGDTSISPRQPRPTHRKDPKPARDWRTRPDPFEAVWARVVAWLEAEPDRTAKELLERLREESPTAFTRAHLRTLQRRVKQWRQLAARRLVFADRHPALSA